MKSVSAPMKGRIMSCLFRLGILFALALRRVLVEFLLSLVKLRQIALNKPFLRYLRLATPLSIAVSVVDSGLLLLGEATGAATA
jgi:hypothetical protein